MTQNTPTTQDEGNAFVETLLNLRDSPDARDILLHLSGVLHGMSMSKALDQDNMSN